MNEQYSPTGFRVLPTVVKHLLIINVLMYLATITFFKFKIGGNAIDLTDYLGLHFFLAKDFMPHQVFTYMFMHANFGHLFFNMFALWMFGNTLENIWGSKRFLVFYIVCGLGAAFCQELVQFIDFEMRTDWNGLAMLNDSMRVVLNSWNTVGASGAIYGLLLAFGMMFPDSRIYLYFLFPIKAKWFVIGYAVLELIMGLGGGDNVAHFAHLGGMLFGLLLILYWRKHPAGPNKDFRKLKDIFQSWKQKSKVKYTPYTEVRDEPRVPRSDEEYNQQKAQREHDIDAILDKVSKSGYGSLTPEEKEFLFKNSK